MKDVFFPAVGLKTNSISNHIYRDYGNYKCKNDCIGMYCDMVPHYQTRNTVNIDEINSETYTNN